VRGGSKHQGRAHGGLLGEKPLNFAEAASRHPDFARELPRFVSEVRRAISHILPTPERRPATMQGWVLSVARPSWKGPTAV
jgi:hypothetical protein